MKRIWMALVLWIGFSGWCQAAQEERLVREVLDNGLTVLVREMPSSPMAAIDAWVKTGSANEGPLVGSGATHFVEHMLFKGTTRRGVGVVSDEARTMGGSINAATSKDYTVFTLSVPRENAAKGLDLIIDMVTNAVFDPAEVEKERLVILKEMNMVNDRPERKLDDTLARTVYLFHPYRYPVIGYPDVFKALTRDQLFAYYKEHYAPNNIVLSVAGGVNASELLPLIKEAVKNVGARSVPMRVVPSEPEQITPRALSITYPTELTRLVVAWQGMSLLDHDLFAGDVLAMALGGGQSSRFYQAFHEEKRLAESIDAANETPQDRGTFEVSALLKDTDPKVVVQEVEARIEQVKREGLNPEELEKVKRQVLAEHIHSRETAEGAAYRGAAEEAMTGDPDFSLRYLDGVKAVTNEDIKRIAAHYLVASRRTVAVMTPTAAAEKTPRAQVMDQVQTKLVTLPNGLKLLLKKDRTLPVLSIRAFLRGGSREETDDKGGLAELTARVWGRGVKGKSSRQMFRETEERGASISVFAGLSLFGIAIDTLSDDLPLACDYLERLLKYPTFPDEEITKERQDMLTALEARKDSIVQTSFRKLNETLFVEHPLRRDPLGTPKTLAGLGQYDLLAYYKRFISAANIVVAVYGDFDSDAMIELLTRRLGDMRSFEVQTTSVEESSPEKIREVQVHMDKQQALVLYGFHAPALKAPDRYALDVAINALSSPLGGRMFKRIRDELGKAYALNGFYTPGTDKGECAFYVLTTDENIAKVRAMVEEELRRAADKGFEDKEIRDAQAHLKGDFSREYQTVSAQAGRDAMEELLGLGFQDHEHFAERVNAVTAAAAREAVRRYLDPSRAAVVVTRSSKQQ